MHELPIALSTLLFASLLPASPPALLGIRREFRGSKGLPEQEVYQKTAAPGQESSIAFKSLKTRHLWPPSGPAGEGARSVARRGDSEF